MPTIYFAGDTGLFGDMKMIAEIYKPEIAFLPIGDHYTMGPDTAAIAAQLARRAAGRADALGHVPGADGHAGRAEEASLAGTGIEVLELKPGRDGSVGFRGSEVPKFRVRGLNREPDERRAHPNPHPRALNSEPSNLRVLLLVQPGVFEQLERLGADPCPPTVSVTR